MMAAHENHVQFYDLFGIMSTGAIPYRRRRHEPLTPAPATRKTVITSSPQWLITLTAMRPLARRRVALGGVARRVLYISRIKREATMDTAKLFWSGRSQAVRLPKEFRFPGREVRIRRHGSAVILEPVADDWSWLDALAGTLDADFARAVEEGPPEQERPALDDLCR